MEITIQWASQLRTILAHNSNSDFWFRIENDLKVQRFVWPDPLLYSILVVFSFRVARLSSLTSSPGEVCQNVTEIIEGGGRDVKSTYKCRKGAGFEGKLGALA